MSTPNRFGDTHVAGALTCESFTCPSGDLDGVVAEVAAGIKATKLEHQHRAVYAQESETTASDEIRVVHVVWGATGTVIAFEAGCVTDCDGSSTITVDLLLNGVSILTSKITLAAGDGNRVVVAGTLSDTALADGDVLEVAIDAVASGTDALGLGVFCSLTLHEDAQ